MKESGKPLSKKKKGVTLCSSIAVSSIQMRKNTVTEKKHTLNHPEKAIHQNHTEKPRHQNHTEQTTYKENEVFQSNGIVLLATYSDESEKGIKSRIRLHR